MMVQHVHICKCVSMFVYQFFVRLGLLSLINNTSVPLTCACRMCWLQLYPYECMHGVSMYTCFLRAYMHMYWFRCWQKLAFKLNDSTMIQ